MTAATSTAPSTTALDGSDLPDLPTKRDESWRYAPHRDLALLSFGLRTIVAVPDDVVAQIPSVDAPRIVVVNGTVDHDLSDLGSLPAGVRFEAFDGDSSDELVVALRAHDHGAPADGFTARCSTSASGGVLIQVSASDVQLHVVDIVLPVDGAAENTSAGRVLVDIANGSSATVVETRLGGGAESGGSAVSTSVTLGEDAQLHHVTLQDLPATQVHLGTVEVTQQRGSAFRSTLFNLGAAYGRVTYHVTLTGADASSDLSGLYFGFGNQILDQQITVVHKAPDCESSQEFRGVLDDSSTGVWIGGVDVRPGADGTDSEQSNDNLVLTRQAEVNTQPRLEILADEVKCAHGATVGQLDETALYYMRSRGIPGAEATRLLIEGFARQVLEKLDDETLVEWVSARLDGNDA